MANAAGDEAKGSTAQQTQDPTQQAQGLTPRTSSTAQFYGEEAAAKYYAEHEPDVQQGPTQQAQGPTQQAQDSTQQAQDSTQQAQDPTPQAQGLTPRTSSTAQFYGEEAAAKYFAEHEPDVQQDPAQKAQDPAKPVQESAQQAKESEQPEKQQDAQAEDQQEEQKEEEAEEKSGLNKGSTPQPQQSSQKRRRTPQMQMTSLLSIMQC